MFKVKEFRQLIGFNHTWLIIVSVIVTGSSFPYIFLGDQLDEAMNQDKPIYVSWIYSGILHFANLTIFYWFKKIDAKRGVVSTLRLFFTRNFPAHLIATAGISTLMAIGPLDVLSMGCPEDILARNIVGTTILMSVIVGFYETAFYMNELRKSVEEKEVLKRENVQAQLDILKNQVQPHFLFNSLNTLASIIPEEPDHAVGYVQKLSKVYRYILEIKDKKLISVHEELECIRAYLFMLETRFGENLNCEISESGFNDTDYIVPLSIQILIENAVKHNVISSKRPLSVKVNKVGDELVVSNNLQRKEQDEPSTKTGLANISKRYDLISKQQVRVVDSDEEFSVYIPLLEVH